MFIMGGGKVKQYCTNIKPKNQSHKATQTCRCRNSYNVKVDIASFNPPFLFVHTNENYTLKPLATNIFLFTRAFLIPSKKLLLNLVTEVISSRK